MKRILLSALALVALASCAKESVETPDVWNGELRISSGITTRASGTKWEANDEIGVFMSETGTETAVGTHNTKYTTTSTSETATFTVGAGLTDLYYPQSGNVDIVAHYPHNSSASVSSYPIDLENSPIDFMSAKMVDVAKSKTALSLEFYHLLSQLKITLTPAVGGGLVAADLASATVKVEGTQVAATATVSSYQDATSLKYLPTATYSLSGDPVAFSTTASSSVASFIVVPQTTDVTITITVASIGEFYVTVDDMALTSGDEHNYTISVSRTAAKVEGATINGWGDGAEEDDTLDATDIEVPKDSDPISFADANFKTALLDDKTINTTDDGEITYGEAKAFSGKITLYNKSISTMSEIEFFTNITELNCCTNSITSLDLSENTKLTALYCNSNPLLQSVDISNNTELTTIQCYDNSSLTSLDLSNNKKLTSLLCYSSSLTSLDLSNNTELTTVSCGNNHLTSLILTDLKNLYFLSCYSCRLSTLDISSCDIVGLDDDGAEYVSSRLRVGDQTEDGSTAQTLTLSISAAQSANGLDDAYILSTSNHSNITLSVQ